MEGAYVNYRSKFQKYRTLCDIGFKLFLLKSEWGEDKKKIEAAYQRASPKDIMFLKIWIKNRAKGKRNG